MLPAANTPAATFTRLHPSADAARNALRVRTLMRILLATGLLLMAGFLATGAQGQSHEAFRGQLLYEQTCTECHAESVHGRKQRKATTFEDIRHYVARWSRAAGKQWTDDEIHNVVVYLNERFYKFPCPTPECKRESAGGATVLGARGN